MRTLALGLVLAWTGTAVAEAAGDPCSGIEAPLAYNACLAEHGPKAGATRRAAEPSGRAPRSGAFERTHRGRVRAIFEVGPL